MNRIQRITSHQIDADADGHKTGLLEIKFDYESTSSELPLLLPDG